jgi:hypothetical protein
VYTMMRVSPGSGCRCDRDSSMTRGRRQILIPETPSLFSYRQPVTSWVSGPGLAATGRPIGSGVDASSHNGRRARGSR